MSTVAKIWRIGVSVLLAAHAGWGLPRLAAAEPARTLTAMLHPTWALILSVAFLAYGGTLFAYGMWSKLLSHYPAALVAPFALLVPVVGMISARLLFGEATSPLELAGAAVVMAGLAITVAGARLAAAARGRIRQAS